MTIRVGPYTTVEEILMDQTLEPKRNDPCLRSPFLVRFRFALDPHFEVLDWLHVLVARTSEVAHRAVRDRE
jgi:hypothetical protein